MFDTHLWYHIEQIVSCNAHWHNVQMCKIQIIIILLFYLLPYVVF